MVVSDRSENSIGCDCVYASQGYTHCTGVESHPRGGGGYHPLERDRQVTKSHENLQLRSQSLSEENPHPQNRTVITIVFALDFFYIVPKTKRHV